MSTKIGRYSLVRQLAVGGMAEVYLARQEGIAGFEKTVVIKRVLPHLVSDKKFITMFLDEARLASRLHHPNLVEIYDLGENKGEYYIAMEYVPGFSAASILTAAADEEVPLPYGLCAHAIMQICSGLKYAHDLQDSEGNNLGLIHRDVAPDNIMVMPSGSVKLIDFGIAKSTLNESHTLTGTIKGKLRYMSPEQLLGRTLDPRADIFALGIVFFELTTGQHPFGQGKDLDIASRIVTEPYLDPKSIRPNFPDELIPILEGALAKSPDDRFKDCGAFHHSLESFLDGLGAHISDNELGVFINELLDVDDVTLTPNEPLSVETLPDIDLAGLDSPTKVQDSPLPPLINSADRQPKSKTPYIAIAAIIMMVIASMFIGPTKSKNEPSSTKLVQGTLKIETTPRVSVRIGDKILGIAPLEVALPEGDYLLKLANEDIMEELSVTIKARATEDIIRIYEQVPLSFNLPGGTEIDVDGVIIGTAPVESFLTYPGVRTITLTSPNGETSETRVIQVGIEGASLTHSWE